MNVPTMYQKASRQYRFLRIAFMWLASVEPAEKLAESTSQYDFNDNENPQVHFLSGRVRASRHSRLTLSAWCTLWSGGPHVRRWG